MSFVAAAQTLHIVIFLLTPFLRLLRLRCNHSSDRVFMSQVKASRGRRWSEMCTHCAMRRNSADAYIFFHSERTYCAAKNPTKIKHKKFGIACNLNTTNGELERRALKTQLSVASVFPWVHGLVVEGQKWVAGALFAVKNLHFGRVALAVSLSPQRTQINV